MNNLAKKLLRTVALFAFWGVVIGAVLGPVIGQFDDRQLLFAALRGSSVGVLIGAGLGVGEEFGFPRWSRFMSFARLSVVRVGSYSLLIITALTAVNAIDRSIVLELGPLDGIGFYASEGGLWRDLIFAVVASFLVTGFLQVRKLHNPGEIRRLLRGQYHYPVEEDPHLPVR